MPAQPVDQTGFSHLNIPFVIRQLGLLMLVLSLSIFAAAARGLIQWWLGAAPQDVAATKALLCAVAVGAALGAGLWLGGRRREAFMGRREALLLVALSWLAGALLAALPFHFWTLLGGPELSGHPFTSFVDCYFEAMSGLTTTGATVLGGHEGHMIGDLPESLLLWRAMTQWLGGLGIVVLFVAVLPSLGVGGKRLFQVEASGPKAPGVRPRIGETARALWMIYLVLTLCEVLALCLAGSSLFDAICHTFATLATGGFSTSDASIGGETAARQWIIVVFMIMAGVNFGLYYQVIHGRFRQVWTDPELRLYLGIMLAACVVVVACIASSPIATTGAPDAPFDPSTGDAVRHGVFQVVALHTGTGFCTADFNQWPFAAKAVLLAVMFAGGSAGSTCGGIKVIRILIAFKVMLAEIERVFRPNVVRTVKAGRVAIEPEQKLATLVYLLGIVMLFLIGTVLIMVLESAGNCSFTTAATASAATLNNIGPGLQGVGAIENYGWFSAPSKMVMCVLMALGRLEVYAILVLFVPRFWKGE
jgi:trk system potassium uptake protein TrkH